MRFNYSADISDYLLYCHNILFLFVLFGFSLATLPVAAAAAELLSSASFDRYKIQPKVKLSSSETFNYYMTVMKLFFLIVGPLQLVSYLPYYLPWTPTMYIPFYLGAEYHDYNHFVGGQSQSNFASVFTYCDYIYGTNKGFCYQKKLLARLEEESGSSGRQVMDSALQNFLSHDYFVQHN